MNPLRALADLLMGRPPIDPRWDPVGGYSPPKTTRRPGPGEIPIPPMTPAPGVYGTATTINRHDFTHGEFVPLSDDWRETMGRCGTDCRCRDHRDALQRLGHAIAEQERLTRELRMVRYSRDLWRERALRAEGKLSHPSSGERAA